MCMHAAMSVIQQDACPATQPDSMHCSHLQSPAPAKAKTPKSKTPKAVKKTPAKPKTPKTTGGVKKVRGSHLDQLCLPSCGAPAGQHC